MSKSLVIVESPAKAKTINKILGDDFVVESSMGHIVDLPQKSMGVDLKDNFKPEYEVIAKKKKILSQLKKQAKDKKRIYLATDPDREGEAIGWHLKEKIGGKGEFLRVVFHEITKEAVLDAFKNPKGIDANKVNAQTARRILDRLVGYLLSPLLWKNVGSRLSAGRVQSVVLRLIVEREKAIKAFIPEEYWQIEAKLKKKDKKLIFTANLEKIDKNKFEIKTEEVAHQFLGEIKQNKFIVSDIQERQIKRNPLPPFITSTLQQEAFNKLKFTANKTMMIAQALYEGIELGKEGPVGLITYMRTDSVRVAESAIQEARDFILENFGKDYLPETPNFYKSKKSAQEAHEAIRPTLSKRKPDSIKEFLTPEQFKLYELIWKRFLSSQMAQEKILSTKIQIEAGRFTFGVTGSKLIFEGFMALYKTEEEKESQLPPFSLKEELDLIELIPSQHFTKPPPRFSDASLVKALEEDGIGRPSTYAPIISNIVARHYVFRQRGYFIPSELGVLITELLIQYFPKVMDIGFTAKMEEELDKIEDGLIIWQDVLNEFYQPFQADLSFAKEHMKKTQIFVDKTCPECGKTLVIKWGRNGRFLSCSGFPACRYAESFLTGVKCPQTNCGGELVERRSKRGGIFFGCSNYPKCTFMTRNLPTESKPAEA
ncbi:MAG: type I DNA topoisomerase [Candidatus Omnitrophota bacterium]|nr:type I DNA topoisomerase [Candidatus Omnitrophota bacterium]